MLPEYSMISKQDKILAQRFLWAFSVGGDESFQSRNQKQSQPNPNASRSSKSPSQICIPSKTIRSRCWTMRLCSGRWRAWPSLACWLLSLPGPERKPANKKSSPQENLTEGNLQERMSKNEQHKKAAAERRPEKSGRDQGCFGKPVESISTGGRSSSVERYSMTLP